MAGWIFEKQFSDNNPPKRLLLQSVLFKHTKDGPVERGLMINSDQVILSMNGATVSHRDLYDYHITQDLTLVFREDL